jgi:hypothetical protein
MVANVVAIVLIAELRVAIFDIKKALLEMATR